MSNLLMLAGAYEFAARAHKGQTRKYTGEPYIVHPCEVMQILVEHVPDVSTEMLCAALLHDVVEDCGVTLEEIHEKFGAGVFALVFWLTDRPTIPGGANRAERKRRACERYSIAPPAAQTIKCADIIANTKSIVEHDPKFAKVYLSEVRALLEVLDQADPTLLERARAAISQPIDSKGVTSP